MEPILLEDFKHNEEPKSLLNLLEYFEKNHLSPNKNDILVGFVYILMLESGFVPREQRNSYEDCEFNYKRILEFSKQLPNNWKKNDFSYSFAFVLPPFQIYECLVACILTADDILVNCIVRGVENGNFSALIDPLLYFLSSKTHIAANMFQNLGHLSRLIKNEVCCPTKQAILRENFIVSCFEELPPEIILLIMSYLKIPDLIHLGLANRSLYELMKTPKLWIRRMKIDFNRDSNARTYDGLKEEYKIELIFYKGTCTVRRNFSNRRYLYDT